MTHNVLRHDARPRVNHLHRIFLQSVMTHQSVRHGGPLYFCTVRHDAPTCASWLTIVQCVMTHRPVRHDGPSWKLCTSSSPWRPLASVMTHRTVRHDAPLASPQVRGAPCRASRRTSSCVMTHHTLTAFSALIPNLISVVSSTIDHETIPRSSLDHSSHPMTDSLAISLVIFIEFDFDHRFLC